MLAAPGRTNEERGNLSTGWQSAGNERKRADNHQGAINYKSKVTMGEGRSRLVQSYGRSEIVSKTSLVIILY